MKKLKLAAALVGLAFLYLAPRLYGLGDYVTTDEPFWLGRSANFYRALQSGEYEFTYQMAHPGVLTMWAGMVGYLVAFPSYPDLVQENLFDQHFIHHLLLSLDVDPLEALNAGRVSKIFLQTVFFVIALLFTRRLLGTTVMALAGMLIALDPFLAGIDSLLHVDGLVAITSFAAILAIADATHTGFGLSWNWGTAGALAACAWLSRSSALLLAIPLLLVLIGCVVVAWRSNQGFWSGLWAAFRSGMAWIVVALVTTLVLWPALWVSPGEVFDEMWEWSSEAASIGHELPTYFRGEILEGDPGWVFYPVTLWWRISPLTLAGLLLCVIAISWMVRNRQWKELVPVTILLAFSVTYVVGMSFGAKKFDRYISPVYLVLELLAAIGFAALATRLGQWPSLSQRVLPGILVLVLVVQGWSLVSVLPYRLDYFNPLAGGPAAASLQLQVGWGQWAKDALDFVAQATPEGETSVVQVSGSDGPFMYFLPDNVRLIDAGLATTETWCATDFFIAGIQQWQRDLSAAYRLVQDRPPAAIVEVEGVEYFRVYEIAGQPPPPDIEGPGECT